MLAIGIIAGLSTQFAIESGQALRHSVPQSAALHRHVHIASQIRPLILLLFLGTNVRLLQIGDRGAKATWQRVHLRKDAPRDRTGGNSSASPAGRKPAHSVSRQRRKAALALAVVIVAGGVAAFANSRRSTSHHSAAGATQPTTTTTTATTHGGKFTPATATIDYTEASLTSLPSAVQDPSAAAFGSGVRFAGGLDSADTSTANVVTATAGGAHVIGQLPSARHDAAGAGIDDALYVFGGGDSAGQLDGIVRVDASGGGDHRRDAARAFVRLDGRGGGRHGLRRRRLHRNPVARHDRRVHARLGRARCRAPPDAGLRYAAVASVGGVLVIAGGSTPSARATTPIYEFDPRTNAVSRVGDLPVAPDARVSGRAGGRSVGGRRPGLCAQRRRHHRRHHPARTGESAWPAISSHPARMPAWCASEPSVWVIGGHNATGTLGSVEQARRGNPGCRHERVHRTTARTRSARSRKQARSLVYVPNSQSDTVDVIDPNTMKVIDHFDVGRLPQHVTPSWDLKTLYVDNDHGNSLTPIDPNTGKQSGPPIPGDRSVQPLLHARRPLRDRGGRGAEPARLPRSPHDEPGQFAFRCRAGASTTWTSPPTASSRSRVASSPVISSSSTCNTSGSCERCAIPRSSAAKPQDVKLSPDGSLFYVADMTNGGVWEIDAHTIRHHRLPADRSRRARPVPEPRRAPTCTSPTGTRER